ncbi:MAG: ERCC4 domain-containing protein [Nanoarchaeota archaeon]|nr:ERCC4 domain-containing protein [Nanoarchaeota archaeon]
MKVIVDYRERSSGMVKELVKLGCDVEMKQLVLADYIIQTKDAYGKEITVGIERKTMQDFFNSIIDKRLIAQLMDMREHFSHVVLIVEGTDNWYQVRDFHPNAIRGMLATITVDLQIPLIQTRNLRDTAAFMGILAKRFEKERSPLSLVQKRKGFSVSQWQEIIVQSLPSVGPTLAKSLLKHFGSIEKVFAASVDDLMKVDKIGKKKAQQIKEIVTKDYDK